MAKSRLLPEPIDYNIEFIRNLDTTKNYFDPLYEEKVKSDIQETEPFDIPGFDQDRYKRLDRLYNPYDPTLEHQLADSQGRVEQFGNFLAQTVIGEGVGGVIEGFGLLGEIFDAKNYVDDHERKWTNGMTELGSNIRDWIGSKTEIFEQDPGGFNPGSFSWWMKNGSSIASTLSIALPGGAIMKGLSWGAKTIKMAQLLEQGLTKVAQVGKIAGKLDDTFDAAAVANKFVKNLGIGVSRVGQAGMSRTIENAMESTGVYDETYNKYSPTVNEDSEYTEEEAKELASHAAALTFQADAAMLAVDVAQFMMLPKFKTRGNSSIKLEKALNSINLTGESKAKIMARAAGKFFLEGTGEGLEEGWQYIAQEEGKHLADVEAGLDDGSKFGERLNKYTKDSELYTSMTMGFAGGMAFQAGLTPIQRSIERRKGIESIGNLKVKDVDSYQPKWNQLIESIEKAKRSDDPKDMDMALLTYDLNAGSNAIRLGNTKHILDFLTAQRDQINNTSEDALQADGITDKDGMVKMIQERITNLTHLEDLTNKAVKQHGTLAPHIAHSEFVKEYATKKLVELDNEKNEIEKGIVGLDQISTIAQDLIKLDGDIFATKALINTLNYQINDTERPDDQKLFPDTKLRFTQRVDTLIKELKGLQTQQEKLNKEYTSDIRKEDEKNGMLDAVIQSAKIKTNELYRNRKFQDLYQREREIATERIKDLTKPSSQKQIKTNKIIKDELSKITTKEELIQFEKNLNLNTVLVDVMIPAIQKKKDEFIAKERTENDLIIENLLTQPDITPAQLRKDKPVGAVSPEVNKRFNDRVTELEKIKTAKDFLADNDLENITTEDEIPFPIEEVIPSKPVDDIDIDLFNGQVGEETTVEVSKEQLEKNKKGLENLGKTPENTLIENETTETYWEDVYDNPNLSNHEEIISVKIPTIENKFKPDLEHVYHGTKSYEIDENGNLILNPSFNFNNKTQSISLTQIPVVAQDYMLRKNGNIIIKINNNALGNNYTIESAEEIAINTNKPFVISKGQYEIITIPTLAEKMKSKYDYEIKQRIELLKEESSSLLDLIDNIYAERINHDNYLEIQEYGYDSEREMAPSWYISDETLDKKAAEELYKEIKNKINKEWIIDVLSKKLIEKVKQTGEEIKNIEDSLHDLSTYGSRGAPHQSDLFQMLLKEIGISFDQKEEIQKIIKSIEKRIKFINTSKDNTIIIRNTGDLTTEGSVNGSLRIGKTEHFDKEYPLQHGIDDRGDVYPKNRLLNTTDNKRKAVAFDPSKLESPNVREGTVVEFRLSENDWWNERKLEGKVIPGDITPETEWELIPIGVYENNILTGYLSTGSNDRQLIVSELRKGNVVKGVVESKTVGYPNNMLVNAGTEDNPNWVHYFASMQTMRKRAAKTGNKDKNGNDIWTIKDNNIVLTIVTGTPENRVLESSAITDPATGEIITNRTIGKSKSKEELDQYDIGQVFIMTTNSLGELKGFKASTATLSINAIDRIFELLKEGKGSQATHIVGTNKVIPDAISEPEEFSGLSIDKSVDITKYLYIDDKFIIYYSNSEKQFLKVSNDRFVSGEGYATIMQVVQKTSKDGSTYTELENASINGVKSTRSINVTNGFNLESDLRTELSTRKYQVDVGYWKTTESYTSRITGIEYKNESKKYPNAYFEYLDSVREGVERTDSKGYPSILAHDGYNDNGTMYNSSKLTFKQILSGNTTLETIDNSATEVIKEEVVIETKSIIQPSVVPNDKATTSVPKQMGGFVEEQRKILTPEELEQVKQRRANKKDTTKKPNVTNEINQILINNYVQNLTIEEKEVIFAVVETEGLITEDINEVIEFAKESIKKQNAVINTDSIIARLEEYKKCK